MSRKQRMAQLWLMIWDGEAYDFWRDLPPDSDFVGAVKDNMADFGGYDAESDRHADFILSL